MIGHKIGYSYEITFYMEPWYWGYHDWTDKGLSAQIMRLPKKSHKECLNFLEESSQNAVNLKLASKYQNKSFASNYYLVFMFIVLFANKLMSSDHLFAKQEIPWLVDWIGGIFALRKLTSHSTLRIIDPQKINRYWTPQLNKDNVLCIRMTRSPYQ